MNVAIVDRIKELENKKEQIYDWVNEEMMDSRAADVELEALDKALAKLKKMNRITIIHED